MSVESDRLLRDAAISRAEREVEKERVRRARWKLINQQKARELRAETARKLKPRRQYKDL